MRGNTFFNALALVGVVTLLASGFLAAASPAPETPYAPKVDDAQDQEPTMGICVIGVESPCNGDDSDGAEEVKDAPKGTHEPWCIRAPCELPAESEEKPESVDNSGQIYCIRAPCELAPEDTSEPSARPIGGAAADPNYVPADGGDQRVGICLVGVDSPCNGEGYGSDFNDAGEVEPSYGICEVSAEDSPCNGGEAQEKRAPEQADEPVESDGRVY